MMNLLSRRSGFLPRQVSNTHTHSLCLIRVTFELQKTLMATTIGDGCILNSREECSLESYKYFLARRTVLEMLRDRGYDVTPSDFRHIFGDAPAPERLRLCLPLRSNPSQKILVVFCGTEEIRTSEIRMIYKKILGSEGAQLHSLVLILQIKINSFARKETKTFPFKVEFFQISDLYFNITKHVLQPKHKVLTSEEKSILLKKYNVEDKQLPRMLESDALAHPLLWTGGGTSDGIYLPRWSG